MNTDMENALAGRSGLAGVQRLLLDRQPQAALRGALAALLPSADMLGECRLHRAKYKPGRHLTAYYEVHVHDPASGDGCARQIEVSWRAESSQDPRGAMTDMETMQAEAVHTGLAAPFRQLMADAPEWGMRVQIAPLDASFPQLVRVSDPRYVREMLLAAAANDNAFPNAPASHYTVTTIRYRPGQRHVLRYDPAPTVAQAANDGTIFAKIYNSDKGERTFSVVTRVANWLAASGVLTAVKPIAYIASDQTVLYPHVSGTPLSELLRTPGHETAAHLRAAGAALHALHATPTNLVELQPHSFAKEIKGIASASEHIHVLLLATSTLIHDVLERARALHERLLQEPPGFAYGDFKSDHLWVTPGGLTLIDFDTCYLADQAIDLGKFLADLQWWCDSYGLADVEHAQAAFLDGYGALSPERLARARLYEVLVLVKSTVRRVRLFDQDWAERTERLVQRADRLLRALEQTTGG
ncbi:MAG TPA: phosphotransferase [Roseiflexaceae bacterium]|nr:phosphotransferase [Roseiflexaceae bacterium]